MKKITRILMISTLAFCQQLQAFVLMGPTDVGGLEDTLGWPANPGGTTVQSVNIIDDLGTPKQLDEFYRWNTPDLTYGFDQTFIEYFGVQGVEAISDAMNVINDFFSPRDGSYYGVSELNFAKHGFGGNFNTAWLNGTAYNENLIDVKSLTLGLMVNYLGLGNPYRYAFTATNAIASPNGASGAIFSVALKNYDPLSLEMSDRINGVQFSYRLIHDQGAGQLPNAATLNAMVLDLEEFTADTSGNAFSTVSAAADAFYGTTQLVWTDVPSTFGFGVYYDGMNAMGGMYKPRHALTYDDAGGLKYLYSTNTIAMEYNPYTLIVPPDYTEAVSQFGLPPSGSEVYNRSRGVFPVRNAAGLPTSPGGGLATPSTHPLNQFVNPAAATMQAFGQGTAFIGAGVGKMDWAYRGGIDAIQFHPMPYDSLLNVSHHTTNFVWIDTFMTNAGIQVVNPATVNSTNPGDTISLVAGRSHYFSQTLGRTVGEPDFIFSANNMAASPNGVPVAFTRTQWDDQAAPTPAGLPTADPAVRWNAALQNPNPNRSPGASGPGIMASLPVGPNPIPLRPTPGTPYSGHTITLNSSFAVGGFQLFWNGEISKVGDLSATPIQDQMWAYIKGPGAYDIVRFPANEGISTMVRNSILPVSGPPIIELVSDNGGQSVISPNSFSRTLEELTILGKNFRDATAIEIVGANNEVVELIYPVTDYIKSDTRIDLPVGILGYDSEGPNRKIKVWNTVGASDNSEEYFSVVTGPPVLTATTFDGLPFNRQEPLTIYGVGFKSKRVGVNDGNATITHIRIEDTSGNAIYPTDGNGSGIDASTTLTVISDSKALLQGGVLPTAADGVGRTIRVSRGSVQTLSSSPSAAFTVISTEPTIASVRWVDLGSNAETDINSTSALRRDEAIFIRGTGLNSVTSVELIQENGQSFNPPVTGYFESNAMEDNGTLFRLGKYAFQGSSADGYGDNKAKLKLTNIFEDVIYSSSFNVNIQPNDGTIAANEEVGLAGIPTGEAYAINARMWNRDFETGDDLVFTGAGLNAIERIIIENADGTNLSPEPTLTLDPDGTPGVVVTDTLIRVDTSVAQFTDANYSDATSKTRYMRFRLESNRAEVSTGQEINQRFIVGVPPKMTAVSISGIGMNWRRDDGNATITGEHMHIIERIDIVDKQGLVISSDAGIVDPGDNAKVTIASAGNSIEINGTAFVQSEHVLDTTRSSNRRIRIVTPWGSKISDDNGSGAFTVSATPNFQSSVALTFGGDGSGFNGIDTYDINSSTPPTSNAGGAPNNLLPLVINGENFLGVKRISFEDNGSSIYYSIDVDPIVPPSGITFSSDGRQITITGKVIYDNNASWANSDGNATRRIKLTSVADQNATTLSIKTDPAWNDNNN